MDYVNENVTDAAQLIEKYDIVPAAVVEKALPACNIVCIDGEEMEEKLSGYLEVLKAQKMCIRDRCNRRAGGTHRKFSP